MSNDEGGSVGHCRLFCTFAFYGEALPSPHVMAGPDPAIHLRWTVQKGGYAGQARVWRRRV